MHFFLLECSSPAAEEIFSHDFFRLRGKQGGLRYITTHVGIPAEPPWRCSFTINVAELVLFLKEFRSASLRRVGVHGKPHNLLLFFNS